MFVTLSCFNDFPIFRYPTEKNEHIILCMYHDGFEKNVTGALQTPQASTNPIQSVDPGTLFQNLKIEEPTGE